MTRRVPFTGTEKESLAQLADDTSGCRKGRRFDVRVARRPTAQDPGRTVAWNAQSFGPGRAELLDLRGRHRSTRFDLETRLAQRLSERIENGAPCGVGLAEVCSLALRYRDERPDMTATSE
jgi:hypothetical protein